MEAMTTGIGSLMSIVGTMLTQITGQPILCVFFVAGLVGTAISVLHQLKRA